ncbi:MAG: Crp/Fnr family transcriptional regulator [Bacteroidia bacterium]|nr:Crp/Fnr family transcriptional regulator [Bacteroidia bacterium]
MNFGYFASFSKLVMQELKNNIIELFGKVPENIDLVLANFSKLNLKRNQLLFEEGKVCKQIYFVQSGLLQLYSIDKKDKEKTLDIILPSTWFTDLESFKNGSPANTSARAVRASTVFYVGKDTFENLMKTIPPFAEAYLKIIEEKYYETNKRIAALNSLNSQEKISWLRINKPEFFKTGSDKLLAEYLGISKETFCRQK